MELPRQRAENWAQGNNNVGEIFPKQGREKGKDLKMGANFAGL